MQSDREGAAPLASSGVWRQRPWHSSLWLPKLALGTKRHLSVGEEAWAITWGWGILGFWNQLETTLDLHWGSWWRSLTCVKVQGHSPQSEKGGAYSRLGMNDSHRTGAQLLQNLVHYWGKSGVGDWQIGGASAAMHTTRQLSMKMKRFSICSYHHPTLLSTQSTWNIKGDIKKTSRGTTYLCNVVIHCQCFTIKDYNDDQIM